jgi:cation:H+ antiporter
MVLALNLGLVFFGFFLLIRGASWLVEGASALANRLGASDLLIGLTVVSMATSAPELLVNLAAAWNKSTDLALANIVGSSIANVLLILGASALVAPLAVAPSTVFREIPFCLLATIIVGILASDSLIDGQVVSTITRSDGLVLLGYFAVFLYYLASLRRASEHSITEIQSSASKATSVSPALLVVVGLAALIAGGEATVRGATKLAQELGVGERVIGLTIIAIGTSLPELITSIVASIRGKVDISIGNVIGSNIFNLFWILGVSAAVTPLPVSSALNRDIAVMVASVVLLLFLIQPGPLMARLRFWRIQRGHVLTRWEGALLVSFYICYIALAIVVD